MTSEDFAALVIRIEHSFGRKLNDEVRKLWWRRIGTVARAHADRAVDSAISRSRPGSACPSLNEFCAVDLQSTARPEDRREQDAPVTPADDLLGHNRWQTPCGRWHATGLRTVLAGQITLDTFRLWTADAESRGFDTPFARYLADELALAAAPAAGGRA